MASIEDKRPLYEVLSDKLGIAASGKIASDNVIEMITILDTLLQGKMPAVAAHKIAEDYAGLPALLSDPEHKNLADLVTEVIADLKSRK